MAEVLNRIAEAISVRYLKPYAERIRQEGLERLGPKQVHDPIWGTISLRPLEVAVLDSPLLQRLRHLRQLGVAHWVYPGADHSRFEHSLGVLFQAQQLISAINRAGISKYNQLVLSEDDQQLIRLAALLHDIGHPVLSHVTEYALRLDPRMLLEIQRERKNIGEKVTISELIAARIVVSEEFVSFLRVTAIEHDKLKLPKTNWAADPSGFAKNVARMILGQNVSSLVPLMHEIVSGPYDADKLDYMIRDPRAAGLPTIIDISRLVQKLTAVRYPTRDLPQAVARLVPQSAREAYLFGFPWSGLSVIDELLLARIMLYAKLYRHPKVAALESIVQSLLDQIAVLVDPERVVGFIYGILDDQLILAGRQDLLVKLGLTEADVVETSKARALEIGVDLLRRLRERELFVRAFAFFPGQPEGPDDAVNGVFDRIIKHIDDQTRRDSLRTAIVNEVRTIMRLLGAAEDSFLFRNADQLVVLRRLQPPSQKELRHAWIFPIGGTARTYEKTSIHKEAWSSSFVSASAKGYLFCPKELAKAVFLAAETVIASEFDVSIPEWMMEETKQSIASLQETKLSLRTKGYYRSKSKLIRPRWPRLTMSDVEIVVSEFSDRFSAVQETVLPALCGEVRSQGAAAMKSRAYSWLDQFESDLDIDCALVLLQKARLISRQDIVGAVRSFIGKHTEFRAASVVSLSKGNDSSQIVQYFAADVGGDLVFYGSLSEAAHAGRDAPLLVVDDFCGSGHQWGNLIGQLFGDADLKRPELNEERLPGLEPDRDYLRRRRVGFIFTAGWMKGGQHVETATKKVGLDAQVYIHLDERELPFADAVLRAADNVAGNADTFLELVGTVGTKLLAGNEPSWSATKVAERRLGYGNRGMLLFFPYNAPSQTLTCMWASGKVDGEPWEPIIHRRK